METLRQATRSSNYHFNSASQACYIHSIGQGEASLLIFYNTVSSVKQYSVKQQQQKRFHHETLEGAKRMDRIATVSIIIHVRPRMADSTSHERDPYLAAVVSYNS